jgi:hypothetical protein
MNPKRLNLPSGRKLTGVELKRFLKVRDALELRYAAMPVSAQVAGTCGVC